MKNIAIIPARSGSKGLKDKNIRPFSGKPLLAYTIEAALKSECFDEVMVSTDSERYANIALQCGARAPFLRSKELSGDEASSWDAIREVLTDYKKMGRTFDTFALLQPTSPLRTADDIKAAFALMKEKQAKAIVSVCEVAHSPLFCSKLPKDGSLVGFLDKEKLDARRQDLPTFYRFNGAIYLAEIDTFVSNGSIYDAECYAYIMPRSRSVDIDSEEDIEYAQFLFEKAKKEETKTPGKS